MAKKTPQFNSSKAKDKWASLQDSAGHSLTKIVEGKASSSDIQKVSTTLGKLSVVAKTVFDEAVDAAEKTALQVQKAGTIDFKDGLTQFELALNSALQASFKETVAQIKDILQLELLEQTEELIKTLGGRFDDIKVHLPPRDLPTINDLLSNNELIVESLDRDDSEKWNRRSDDLLDRIYHMFNEASPGAKANVPAVREPSASKGYVKGQRHVMNPYELKTIADQGQSIVGTVIDNESDITDVDSTDAVNLSPGIKNAEEVPVAAGVDSSAGLFKRLGALLAGKFSHRDKGPESDVEDTKKEKEKADTWWRSFKGWIGDKWEDKKKKGKDWLKTLMKDLAGVGLLTLLFNPQLWKTLADKIEEYVTWDNIKSAAFAAWNFLKDKTDTVVNWLLDTLGIKHDKHELPAKLTESSQKQLDNMPVADRLAGMGPDQQGIELDSMTPAKRAQAFKDAPQLKAVYDTWTKNKERNGKYQTELGKWWGDVKEGAKDEWSSISTFVGNGFRSKLPSTTSPAAGSSSGTTVNNSTLSIAPGVTGDRQGSSAKPASGASTGGATGSPQVGIGTFGFQSGVDDGLMLMNSSFLGN